MAVAFMFLAGALALILFNVKRSAERYDMTVWEFLKRYPYVLFQFVILCFIVIYISYSQMQSATQQYDKLFLDSIPNSECRLILKKGGWRIELGDTLYKGISLSNHGEIDDFTRNISDEFTIRKNASSDTLYLKADSFEISTTIIKP